MIYTKFNIAICYGIYIYADMFAFTDDLLSLEY